MKKALSLFFALVFCLGMFPSTSVLGQQIFSDVSEDSWYFESVQTAYQSELMMGTGGNRFAPNEPLTRAMFVTILGRMDGFDPKAYPGSSFPDVPEGQWYSPYVMWAVENEITYGIGDHFGTNDNVTREQMATFIARYVKAKGIQLNSAENPVSGFKDEDKVSDWAKDAIELMRTTGILVGDNSGNFNPANGATRAEAATVFCRLKKSIEAVHTMAFGDFYAENNDVLVGSNRAFYCQRTDRR